MDKKTTAIGKPIALSVIVFATNFFSIVKAEGLSFSFLKLLNYVGGDVRYFSPLLYLPIAYILLSLIFSKTTKDKNGRIILIVLIIISIVDVFFLCGFGIFITLVECKLSFIFLIRLILSIALIVLSIKNGKKV